MIERVTGINLKRSWSKVWCWKVARLSPLGFGPINMLGRYASSSRIWSPEAVHDVRDIHDYIETFNPTAAARKGKRNTFKASRSGYSPCAWP
jgi:hypothetical protein